MLLDILGFENPNYFGLIEPLVESVKVIIIICMLQLQLKPKSLTKKMLTFKSAILFLIWKPQSLAGAGLHTVIRRNTKTGIK